MSDIFGLKVHEKDHVATVFALVSPGEDIAVCDHKGQRESLVAISEIPYGHKIAIADISEGEQVFKYGESIGRATCLIKKGEHVHVHNMESLRGRGDFLKDDQFDVWYKEIKSTCNSRDM